MGNDKEGTIRCTWQPGRALEGATHARTGRTPPPCVLSNRPLQVKNSLAGLIYYQNRGNEPRERVFLPSEADLKARVGVCAPRACA